MLERKKVDNFVKAHQSGNRSQFGSAGKSFVNAVADEVGGIPVKVSFNPSGSVDRGYISGFIKYGDRYVYITIHSLNGEILYRAAKNEKDYAGGPNNWSNITQEGLRDMCVCIKRMLQGGAEC